MIILSKIIATIIIAVLNSVTYRAGGSDSYPRYLRPLGVGLSVLAIIWLWCGFHWSLVLSAGASAGLSTTYFKHKGEDAHWINWLFVGSFLSIAMFPWALFTHHFIGLAIRTFVLGALVCGWSERIGNAVVEECGRGFLIVATLPLLFIGGI